MTHFAFKDPWILLFLLLIPLFIFFARKKNFRSDMLFSSQELLNGLRPSYKSRLSVVTFFLRGAAMALIIISLARPQTMLEGTRTVSEGVDIVLALDTSSSMLAEDFKVGNRRVNRFDVVKEVVKEFIGKRKDDRIAMVAFAARAYTVTPLSTDYPWLFENLDRIKVGMIEDATAIGSAIASSINRLRTSKTKSRIIILLTDGVNNAGTVSPIAAAEAAHALKVKIYTICVGTKGLVPYPFKDVYGRTVYRNIPIEIDEASLKRIAEITGGKYYLATNTEALRSIYSEIDKLEKSNIEHFGYREYNELFGKFMVWAILLILLEVLLANTVFFRIP